MNEIVSRVINTRSVMIPITLMYLCDVKTSGWIFSPCVFKMKFASNKRIIIVKCGTESLSWDWTFLGTEKCMSKKAVMYGCLQSFLKVSSVAKTYKRITSIVKHKIYLLLWELAFKKYYVEGLNWPGWFVARPTSIIPLFWKWSGPRMCETDWFRLDFRFWLRKFSKFLVLMPVLNAF